MPPTDRTEADAVADIARQGQAPALYNSEHIPNPFIIFPAKGEVMNLEKLMAHPPRKRGTFQAENSTAFIAYVARHRMVGTLLHGQVSTTGGSFHSDIDGHEPANTEMSEDELPGWREHHCHLQLPLTPEWEKWLKYNGQLFEQAQFAEFIEDSLPEITVPGLDQVPTGSKWPDATTMLNVACTLEARSDVQFSSGIRLQNNQQQLTYAEVINGQATGAEGKIAIPEKFALAIAPFVDGPKYLLIARLRYYLNRGKVTFKYQLERPHKVIEDAYNGEKAKIEEALKLPVLRGRYA